MTVAGQQIPQTIIYQPTRWRERDIALTAKLGSELMRRAADMPAGKPDTDWRAELQRQFPELDPDEVIETIADVLADLLNKRTSKPSES